MAKLSEEEIAEIRRAHGIKPEHIGKQVKYHPPRKSGKGDAASEWVTEHFS